MNYSDVLLSSHELSNSEVGVLSSGTHFEKESRRWIHDDDDWLAAAESQLAVYMEAHGWGQFPLKHLWNLGYQAFPIMRIMNTLPIRPKLAIKYVSDLLSYVVEESISTSKNLHDITTIDAGFFGREHMQLDQPDISEIWDCETQLGLIRVLFDPHTQIRQQIDSNCRAAQFWGMDKDEFLSQCRNNNIPLLLCEIDWLRSFAVYLTRYFDDSITQYLRFSTKSDFSLHHYLVRVTSQKVFDSLGRITQVCTAVCDLPLFLHLDGCHST